MDVVAGATSSLLPKLGALLQDEYKLQDKVKKDIESLQNELVFMNATLRMVAEVPRDQLDEHVRIWAVFIKELSFDMEDVVNTFVARVQVAPHLVGLIRKAFNMLCMGRTHHQIASMVEEIKGLIKEVADLRDRYRFDNIVTRAATPIVLLQRENTLIRYLAADCEEITRRHIGIKYEEPMGVDEDMKVLHDWVTSGDKRSMMFILGPPGVGKSTIAMALYRNYGNQFQRRAMVKWSKIATNPRPFYMDILSQVAQVNPRELQDLGDDTDKIMVKLRECLKGKRLLILTDGVWSTTMFRPIRGVLNMGEEVRIIATTESEVVARSYKNAEGCVHEVHEVGLLNGHNAKQLFMEVVVKENQKVIPSCLWERCGGLPLAIVTTAGQFACNPDKSDEEWEVLTALTPTPNTSHTAYPLMKIISTCYNDMPVEIKICALYFSIFPRGKKIGRKRLTRRWVSEGFIIEQQGLSAEEVAETYLNHLIRRKFLQATEHSSNGKVKSYHVHDVILEYIVSKASEENFTTTIGGWVMPPPSSKIRRLSIQCSGSSYEREIKIMNLSHVRDLTMFGSLKQLPSSSFKFGVAVQLLDLEGCKDFKHHHIKDICRMLLLKYLSLRRTDIKKLTKRIGDLRYLETLDIRETNVIELPSAICKLERLVNIFGGNKTTRKALKVPKLGKGKMKALRVLTGIEVSPETVHLPSLPNLRKLAIYKININKAANWIFRLLCSLIEYHGSFSLCALVVHDETAQFLEELAYLESPPKFLNALELTGKVFELPKWVAELDTLTKLTLSATALRADNLKLLSEICSLSSLTFSHHAAKQDQEKTVIVEENGEFGDGAILFPVGGFENLKLLRFIAPYVPQLSFPDGALPTLERLVLRFSNFEGLLGIRGLKNLQQVQFKVHEEASETTKSIVQEMATAAREDREGPRIIFD